MHDLLSDDRKRIRLGENAKAAVKKETGVSKITVDLIFSLLESNRLHSGQAGCPLQTPYLTGTTDGGVNRTVHPGGQRSTVIMLLLSFFSGWYGWAVFIRFSFYRLGIFKVKRLKAKVISVGNITAGGTGKTPLVIYLAEKLREENRKVAILSRGYKRENKEMVDLNQGAIAKASWEDAGDEPYMMSRRLIDIPIIINKHRSVSGPYAIEKYGAEILILDDGFQHLKIRRDLDIVVIDSTIPFGNGKLLPVGILREPLSSLKRADILVLTKTDQMSDNNKLKETLRKYNPQAPMVESVYRIHSVEKFPDNSAIELKELEDKKALAFSGIGNPASFENSLKQLKVNLAGHRIFPDHYSYRSKDISSLVGEAKNLGVDFIITTEKDSVRIPMVNMPEIPVYVLKIDLRVISGENILLNKIEE